jgi:integrase
LKDLPKYVHRRRTRHGREVIHFSKTNRAPYIRICETPGTPEFWAVYAALLKGEKIATKAAPEKPDPVNPDTFRQLQVRFIKARFAKSANTGAAQDKRVLEHCGLEKIAPHDKRTFSNLPLSQLSLQALEILRDRKATLDQRTAANKRVMALKRMCKWAAKHGILTTDPSIGLEKVEITSEGHKTWKPEDITKYEDRHKDNPQALLALTLLLHTGAARCDAIRLGPSNIQVEDGKTICHYKRKKIKKEGKGNAYIPVSQTFLDSVANYRSKNPVVGVHTFIAKANGQPYSVDGFGRRFAKWCRHAGVEGRAHGLRKAAATRMAMRGATAHELMWMFGWLTLSEAERYTREADRRRGGARAARLLEQG